MKDYVAQLEPYLRAMLDENTRINLTAIRDLDAARVLHVQDSLAMRDLARDLREEGVISGGPPPFGKADRQRFINALDRTLTALLRR